MLYVTILFHHLAWVGVIHFSCLKIPLQEYSLITNKHNQKLINILKNQKIYGGFLMCWYFRFHFPWTHLLIFRVSLCKWVHGKWNLKYQYFKKTSINLLLFQYVNLWTNQQYFFYFYTWYDWIEWVRNRIQTFLQVDISLAIYRSSCL